MTQIFTIFGLISGKIGEIREILGGGQYRPLCPPALPALFTYSNFWTLKGATRQSEWVYQYGIATDRYMRILK